MVETAGRDSEEIVRRHVDAFNGRDLDGLMACFSERIIWTTGTDTFRGLETLRELFAGAFSALSPQLDLQRLIADGELVACELREDFLVDGVKRTDYIAGFYRVASHRITRAKIYRQGSADV